MDINQQKEQFSKAYVRDVASVAGYSIYESDVDDDSVDISIAQTGGNGTTRSPKLDIQLKCTEMNIMQDDGLHYPLKIKNYNDLRGENFLVPRMLVVVLVPDDLDDWLEQTADQLIMKHCGYWKSLRTEPETDNTTSVTVVVSKDYIFNVDSLRNIMQCIGNGGVL